MDDPTNSGLPFSASTNPRVVRPAGSQMNTLHEGHTTAANPGLSQGDIYYTLFRHKWKIILCSLVGVGAAVAFYKLHPPPYQSEAKLFIRYVDVGQALSGPADTTKTVSPDMRGETVMNSEVEILTSLDLARQVADAVGPAKILAKDGGGNSRDAAAYAVENGLTVTVPKNTSVIDAVFKSPNSAIVQPVMTALIAAYLKRHVEVHESVGILGDYLTQETDQLRARLVQTEQDLKKARDKAGVISVADARKRFADQIDQLQSAIFAAEADLAQREAALKELTGQAPSSTSNSSATSKSAAKPTPPAEVDAYQALSRQLSQLRSQEQTLLAQYTPANPLVTGIHARIENLQSRKLKLETEYPALARTVVSSPSTPAAKSSDAIDPRMEAARIVALQARIKVLQAQLAQVEKNAGNLDQLEVTIEDLRRKQDLDETNYKYYAANLEQSRINEALGNGRVSNISQIQAPSPPTRDMGKRAKIMAMLAFGGVGLGLAWAFSIEMYFDRSVRRPAKVERSLGVPLFLTIPDISRNGQRKRLAAVNGARLQLPPGRAGSDSKEDHPAPKGGELVRWDPDGALYPFYETLRDRLIGYFESRNVTHRPKLVSVTGFGRDSGVTTIAAGLAGCLSETGEGNVLLVDMTVDQGSAQQFYKGKAVCGLDEALDKDGSGQVQDKLYVVSEEPKGDKLSRALPQRFTKLVPKLMASDFDYIIFDMPPVSQISITPRLAGFMDMVLMVIESEKTDQDVVRRARALLADSKAPVGAVLNKTRTYVPPRLHQETLDDL